ncbi:MAG: hypothetical protein ACD_3C00147G0003 [uncultured bacterium (gcode 4)]|uniref:Uncharacterized protein n=1 Tax=uncultured bacterium (gcode 4) TaxID=1234023 RepID=K2F9J5_9BACT|nr:MAG: hypothetical protein ACD_3C00147G0003 [uncultured bacterium (gcode 4)]
MARHFASVKNWNEEIFKVRDERAWETNWNLWREFKPVALFYWEILGNSWKEEDLKKLEELLGEKWLLANDDIFGEGFFMGLEILHSLRKKSTIKNKTDLINNKYLNIIKNHKDICKKEVEMFKIFQGSINFIDNEYIQEYWYNLKNCIIQWSKEIDLKDAFYLWYSGAINFIWEKLDEWYEVYLGGITFSLEHNLGNFESMMKNYELMGGVKKLLLKMFDYCRKKDESYEAEEILSIAVNRFAFEKSEIEEKIIYLEWANINTNRIKSSIVNPDNYDEVKILIDDVIKDCESNEYDMYLEKIIDRILNRPNNAMLTEYIVRELMNDKKYSVIRRILIILIWNNYDSKFIEDKIELLISYWYLQIQSLLFTFLRNWKIPDTFVYNKIKLLKQKGHLKFDSELLMGFNDEIEDTHEASYYIKLMRIIIDNIGLVSKEINTKEKVTNMLVKIVEGGYYIEWAFIEKWIIYYVAEKKYCFFTDELIEALSNSKYREYDEVVYNFKKMHEEDL